MIRDYDDYLRNLSRCNDNETGKLIIKKNPKSDSKTIKYNTKY